MNKKLNTILLILAALVVALLSIANIQSVKISYLFGDIRMPLIILILISVALGFAIEFLVGLPKSVSNQRQLAKLQKELSRVQAEFDKLNRETRSKKPIQIIDQEHIETK